MFYVCLCVYLCADKKFRNKPFGFYVLGKVEVQGYPYCPPCLNLYQKGFVSGTDAYPNSHRDLWGCTSFFRFVDLRGEGGVVVIYLTTVERPSVCTDRGSGILKWVGMEF